MATWHGYVLIEVNPAVADGWDDEKRDKVRDGVKTLVTATTKNAKEFPPYLLQVRWSLNHRAVILEANLDATSKSEFVKKIAAALGVTQTAVNNATTLTVFGGGKSWDESRIACAAYIEANSAAWNRTL